jgi:NAD(P)-dependent dehydrogenase (short-subunit alcohol dehydrogenase family)
VSVPADMAKAAGACVECFGGVDILHYNVGLPRVGGMTEISLEDWNKSMTVNVTGMFLANRAVLPIMEEQYRKTNRVGAIVNIGAVAAIRWTGVPMLAYAVSKAGVEALTRCVALEYAKRGVRCNCIHPGLLHTPQIVEPLKNLYGENNLDELMEVRKIQAPMGCMGDAWDVAYAALTWHRTRQST